MGIGDFTGESKGLPQFIQMLRNPKNLPALLSDTSLGGALPPWSQRQFAPEFNFANMPLASQISYLDAQAALGEFDDPMHVGNFANDDEYRRAYKRAQNAVTDMEGKKVRFNQPRDYPEGYVPNNRQLGAANVQPLPPGGSSAVQPMPNKVQAIPQGGSTQPALPAGRVNIGQATYGTGPIAQPAGQTPPSLNPASNGLGSNTERLAAAGVRKGSTGTFFADPQNIDLASLRDPNPRFQAPRGNLNGGAYFSDGNGGLGAKAVQTVYGPNTPPGWTPPAQPQPTSIGNATARMPSEALIGQGLGKAANSSPMLPTALTQQRTFKGSGMLNRVGTPLAALAAQGWVDENVNPNTSVGPFNKGTVNATLGGAAVGGGVAGPVGGVVGGLGAGLGDMGAKVVNADTDDMNLLGQLGTGLVRGGLAIPGFVAGLRDEGDNEAQGGVADLFKEGGPLGAVGGLVGMGGDGGASDQPQQPTLKPQEMLDRAWDMTQMDPELRQSMQIVKDLRVQSGEDEKAVAEDMLNDILGEYTTRQQQQQELAEVAAQQQQAMRYMRPYAESIRAQGQAQAAALQGMIPMLPPQFQAYGQMAITGAGTRANTLADSLMAQASMAPSQAIQQRQQQAEQAYQDQLNQQIMAINIQNDLFNMQQSGQAPVPLDEGGGI